MNAPAEIPPERLLRLWQRTEGKGWEPPDPRHPAVLRLLACGFVRRVDGRCGFERFKDSHLAWTQAGRMACQALAAAGQQENQSDTGPSNAAASAQP